MPGAASGQFQQLLRVLHEEMRSETPDPPVANSPPSRTRTTRRGTIYNRPLDDLEIARGILFPSLSVTPPSVFLASEPLVLRDPRGVALVPLVNGAIPPPFVDANGDGLADLDALGGFVTSTARQSPLRSSRSMASMAPGRRGSR